MSTLSGQIGAGAAVPASEARPLPPARDVAISVVVPTFRRPQLIVRCLAALIAQKLDASSYEVVVVDDGRTADTQAAVNSVAARFPNHAIRYLRPERGRGPAAARNAGWRAAHGAVIAFTDDDTVPDADWLREGLRAIAGDIAAVAGRLRVPTQPRPGRERVTDHELMTLGLESAEFVTANAFVRRSALVAVGGFDTRFERAWREDSDLQFMLLERGLTIARCPQAVVLHPVRKERWGVSLRQQKNVFYDALLFRKHPRLYRERILAAPPWNYYGIVVLSVAAGLFAGAENLGSAAVSAAIAVLLVTAFAKRRLRTTSRSPGHVLEMLLTSAAIPFLSVYWRLRGAVHFRVAYF